MISRAYPFFIVKFHHKKVNIINIYIILKSLCCIILWDVYYILHLRYKSTETGLEICKNMIYNKKRAGQVPACPIKSPL